MCHNWRMMGFFFFTTHRCGVGGCGAQEAGGSYRQFIVDFWKRRLCSYSLLCK